VGGLARTVARARWLVVGVWLVLTVAGAVAAGKLSDRWFQEFSIPGYSAYEANSRIFQTFGIARQYPVQLVFHEGQQPVQSFAVAVAPGGEQLGHLVR